MNKNLIKTFFRSAKEVKMDKEKKDSIERELLLFMKNNPVKAEESLVSRIFFAWPASLKFKFAVPAAITLLLIITVAGVSAKAETALPGDIFYPVKTGFNEKIALILSFSDEAKTYKNIQFAERRLEEAEQLIIKGKINENNQAQINNNFEGQLKKATDSIEKLNNAKMYEEAVKVSSDLEASLSAHSHILENLSGNKTEDNFDKLTETVKDASSKISHSNTGLIDKAFSDPVVKPSEHSKITQDKMRSAEDSLEKAKKIIKDKNTKIEKDISAQVEDNLKKAEEKIKEGKSKIEDARNNFKDSFSSFQEADVIAKESKKIIEDSENLKPDKKNKGQD